MHLTIEPPESLTQKWTELKGVIVQQLYVETSTSHFFYWIEQLDKIKVETENLNTKPLDLADI